MRSWGERVAEDAQIPESLQLRSRVPKRRLISGEIICGIIDIARIDICSKEALNSTPNSCRALALARTMEYSISRVTQQVRWMQHRPASSHEPKHVGIRSPMRVRILKTVKRSPKLARIAVREGLVDPFSDRIVPRISFNNGVLKAG